MFEMSQNDLEARTFHGSVSTSDLSTTNSASEKPMNISETSSHDSIPTSVLKALSEEHLTINKKGLVTFSDASPGHPRQWSLRRKLYDSAIICLLEFVTTLVSNAGSNIAKPAAAHVGVSLDVSMFCLATLYMLGQAIGNLVVPPVTEVFGSKSIYASSTALYAALCFMTGFAPHLATIVTGRFFCGFLSAMPTCVAIGSIENMWDSRARIWAIAVWAAAGIFAMAVGPLYAVYVSDSSLGWHWAFILAGIACGILSLLCLTMLESRPSQVLRQKVKKISKQTGYTALQLDSPSLPTLKQFAKTSLKLPLCLLFTEPIVAVASVIGAIVVSLIYLFAEAIPIVYSEDFALSRNQSALVFLVIGAGVFFSFIPRLWDIRKANERVRRRQASEPEDKLFGFLLAAPLLAVGLWWFGATIPPVAKHISPYVSMPPVLFVGFAAVEFDTVLSGYLTNVYGSHAASANAPMCFLRALVSGVFPIIGRRMFKRMGSSGASFLLAGLATAFVGVAAVFWRYGRAIRRRSRFAQITEEETEFE